MEDHSNEILSAVREIRDLIQLIAEPAIAARDKKFRDQLRKIVGNSKPKAKAVLLMNGSLLQTDIHRESGMQKSNLSTLVKQLAEAKLLWGMERSRSSPLPSPPTFGAS